MRGTGPSLKVIERAYVTDRVRKTKLTAAEAREEFKRGIAEVERAAAVLSLLDRLEAAERERDVLGKAAFAAVVASGEDVDGAETWESYFRPMKYPSWVDAVHQNVTSLREERDQSDREALVADAKIAAVKSLLNTPSDERGITWWEWIDGGLGGSLYADLRAALQESKGE